MPLRFITPHVRQLTRYVGFNAYLVRQGDELTLIDTLLPRSEAIVERAIGTLGLPLRGILLTHAHGDHVGSLDALHARFPHADVSISARDARLLRGDTSLDPTEPNTPVKGDVKVCATRPTRHLADGDRVGPLLVVATPGHTPGHVALLDERDGTLIAGDAFQSIGGLDVAGTPRLLNPFTSAATWHQELALTSARRLLELRPARLAVGHGPVLEAPLPAMRRAIEIAERRLELAYRLG